MLPIYNYSSLHLDDNLAGRAKTMHEAVYLQINFAVDYVKT